MLLGVMSINKLSIYLSIKGFLQGTVIQRSVFNSFSTLLSRVFSNARKSARHNVNMFLRWKCLQSANG